VTPEAFPLASDGNLKGQLSQGRTSLDCHKRQVGLAVRHAQEQAVDDRDVLYPVVAQQLAEV
jgi:hypothetical protein